MGEEVILGLVIFELKYIEYIEILEGFGLLLWFVIEFYVLDEFGVFF